MGSILGHADLTAKRRGAAEGRIEALREIAKAKSRHPGLDPMVTGSEAALTRASSKVACST